MVLCLAVFIPVLRHMRPVGRGDTYLESPPVSMEVSYDHFLMLLLPTSAFTSVASLRRKSQHPGLACLLPTKHALWYTVDTVLRLTNHPHPLTSALWAPV